MTAFGAVVVGYRAAKAEKARIRAESATLPALKSFGARIVNRALIIAACGLFCTAAFLFDTRLGYAVAGLSAIYLDFELT